MIRIGRPINGITINGLEYLLDDDGKEMQFQNEQKAKEFLAENGVAAESLDAFEYEEVMGEDLIIEGFENMSPNRIEIEHLIYEDYAVRNTNPHFLITDGKVHIYSHIDNKLYEDTDFDLAYWDISEEDARTVLIKYGFKELPF